MTATKITAKVYEPLWNHFKQQTDRLFLKRDAFLNHMIRIETPHLVREVEGKRMSIKARRYIAGNLKRMGTVTVNIVVDQEVSNRLNEVIKNANLVRDGFINRLLMWLRSSDVLLRSFGLPTTLDGLKEWNGMPVSPMKAMEAVRDDPLCYIRSQIESDEWGGLYTLYLPEPLTALSCYLSDEHVSGTEDFKKRKEMEDLLNEGEMKAFTRERKRVAS